MKRFRLNVIISYSDFVNPKNFRIPITDILRYFSWIYELDFALQTESEVFDDLPNSKVVDIVYFRSNARTRITLREFQKVLNTVFQYQYYGSKGVEVFYQLQKSLKQFPFPDKHIRPLYFPHVLLIDGVRSVESIAQEDLWRLFPEKVHFDGVDTEN